VVHDDKRGQLDEKPLEVGKIGGLEIDDDVPAERCDASRERRQHVGWRDVDQALDEIEPRTAHTGGIELGELRVAGACRDRRDAARSIARGAQCVDDRAVVGAVARGLYEHVALETEVVAQRPELFLACIAGRVLTLRRVREARARSEHVAVRVHAAGRQSKARLRRLRMKRQPASIHREWARRAFGRPARATGHGRRRVVSRCAVNRCSGGRGACVRLLHGAHRFFDFRILSSRGYTRRALRSKT
jgi:hypothetical protein